MALLLLFLVALIPASAAIAAETGYVPPESCRTCHPEIDQTYRQTGMGRSVNPGKVPEGSYYHRMSNRHYRIFERDGKMYLRRHMIDASGSEVHVLEKSIDAALGSGNHAISYLHRDRSGTLWQLPLSWYSADGGYWAMSPGYDRRDHFDFRREVSDSCLFCHTAYPQTSGSRDLHAIDCQRCHGPGARHAATPARSNIINPTRLEVGRALDVCLQCHLETESRAFPDSMLRLGRTVFSFRPGEKLTDFKVFFDLPKGPVRDTRFEINSAGYRILDSPCYKNSGGRLSCTTCHNPHGPARGAEAVENVRRACLGCHESAHAEREQSGRDCASCHMPKRRTTDAVHVVMTDHRIGRPPIGGDPLARIPEHHEPYRGPLVLYRSERESRDLFYLAAAQIREGTNLSAGMEMLERLIAAGDVPSLAAAKIELAAGYRQRSDWKRAASLYREGLSAGPPSVLTVVSFAEVLLRLNRLEEALRHLQNARGLAPSDPRVLNPLAIAVAESGEPSASLAILRQAVESNPQYPTSWMNLAVALERAGDTEGAEAAYREVLRVQPDLSIARMRLDMLRRVRD